jgi:fatty acid desaturase
MANMTSSERAQYERAELHAPDRTMRVANKRPVVVFTGIALVILAALVYATAWGIDGWAHAMVLGVIVLTVIGLIIAVSPTRRA